MARKHPDSHKPVFRASARDIDLYVALTALPPEEGGMQRPCVIIAAKSSLGRQWFTPERQHQLATHQAELCAKNEKFGIFIGVDFVLASAKADGLVVSYKDEIRDVSKLLWDDSSAARTHGGGGF